MQHILEIQKPSLSWPKVKFLSVPDPITQLAQFVLLLGLFCVEGT